MNFFEKRLDRVPRIYAYKVPNYEGVIKIGYTTKTAHERVSEQFPVKGPYENSYDIIFDEPSIRRDGSFFTDKDIHKLLKKNGIANTNGEWFECSVENLYKAYNAICNYENDILNNSRIDNYALRVEQKEAIDITYNFFKNNSMDKKKFLWNAKMRFGKTFAAYKLIEKLNIKKVLILTFKPSTKNSWETILNNHVDFKDFVFVNKNFSSLRDESFQKTNICFGSFQDILMKNKYGGIKLKNEELHKIKWDLVIIDEYHYGAWRDRSKELFETNTKESDFLELIYNNQLHISCNNFLFLSGTPFRAISNGEFLEDEIFNWTYIDEQKCKEKFKNDLNNPYSLMPRMIMMTYKLPDELREIALKGEFDEFSLNEFFSAHKNEKDISVFKHEEYVIKFLDFIIGKMSHSSLDNLKLKDNKPPLPFSDSNLVKILNHTFWLLPNVASCEAMKNLLENINFFKKYKIILAAGPKSKTGDDLIKEIHDKMGNPLETYTITLSCQKLTTGVTIKPWTAIFMLRSLESPETYFQAAFRVQTPWFVKNDDYEEKNKFINYKKNCYVFDFDPNRALKQIAAYGQMLNTELISVEKKIDQFIKFLPILAYNGEFMHQIDAKSILDFTISNTTSVMLAKKWESATLVNVDNETLKRLINNPEAIKALEKIEGFRNINSNISILISKNETLKKLRDKSLEQELTKEEEKEVNEIIKEERKNREFIQKKLIKFASRIPIFMYLTDYREECLKDIITELEPQLFTKVTGLTIKDFDLLLSLNLFNDKLMNEAIFSFKRYEESSLSYSGIAKNNSNKIGLFNTSIIIKGS